MTYNIHIATDNPILNRLLTEQLSGLKFLTLDPAVPSDCTLVTDGKFIPQHGDVLHLPKGAVRLGDIIDKLGYLLSGRETHIEDDGVEIDFGLFLFTPAQNMLQIKQSGETMTLTDKERLLLRVLYEAGATGLPRKDLLKSVWGYADDAETHTLETHLYRLRQKLELAGAGDIIKVQDGVYTLMFE